METIAITTPVWNIEFLTDYKPLTTFWDDFSIAERFGVAAIKDTFKRAFAEWKDNYKYLTELVMVLNHKLWFWFEENSQTLARVYEELYHKADCWACENLVGEKLEYFYATLD